MNHVDTIHTECIDIVTNTSLIFGHTTINSN